VRIKKERFLKDSPSVVNEPDEYIEHVERNRGRGEHYLRYMVFDKRPPSLRWRRGMPDHVPSDGGLGNINTELPKFTMDSRRSPQQSGLSRLTVWIRAHCLWNARPSGYFMGNIVDPVPAKASSVRSHDGLEFDDR